MTDLLPLRTACFLMILGFGGTLLADTSTVDVTINSVDARQSTITVSYDGKSRQLNLATNVMVEIDGKRSEYRSLLPGDEATVTYDKERAVVTKIVAQRAAMLPAEKLAEGWDEIDQRLIFLMVRLANTEASLDAIDQAIDAENRRRGIKTSAAKKADRANEDMDRKGGGPMKWSQFYGMTAEKFFYHPTDRNTTYHTTTVLSQQGPQADNKVGGGVPASQGLPVHQRPPQFDYIYRANDRAKARAETEAAELRGKIDELNNRRRRLEAEQAGLWVEIAFRAISHYDLDKKPLYRFEPVLTGTDSESRQRAETMKAASVFMALALSIIAEAEKDQAGTFTRIKPAVAQARQSLNDAYLRLAIDVINKQSNIGRFVALSKQLDDVAANLTDSYIVAMEGDSAKDEQRKETFRALLQESLINYAQIVLAIDEMASLMQDDFAYEPDLDKPIRFSNLVSIAPVRPLSVEPAQLSRKDLLSNVDASTLDDSWSVGNDGLKSANLAGKSGFVSLPLESNDSYDLQIKLLLLEGKGKSDIHVALPFQGKVRQFTIRHEEDGVARLSFWPKGKDSTKLGRQPYGITLPKTQAFTNNRSRTLIFKVTPKSIEVLLDNKSLFQTTSDILVHEQDDPPLCLQLGSWNNRVLFESVAVLESTPTPSIQGELSQSAKNERGDGSFNASRGDLKDGRFDILWDGGWTFVLEVKGDVVLFHGEINPDQKWIPCKKPLPIPFKLDSNNTLASADNQGLNQNMQIAFQWNQATKEASRINPATKKVEKGRVVQSAPK